MFLAWETIREAYPETVLTSVQKNEMHGFKNKSRQKEYLATRGLVKEVAEALGLNKEHFRLKKTELGKPYGVHGKEHYQLSIAHTNVHVICGISPNRSLGVDAEPADRLIPEKLRRRITNEDELALLEKEPAVRVWTIKEAIVKLEGRGMRTNLNDCTITSRKENEFTAIFDNDKKAKICSFLYKNNWLAIAWNFK